MPASSTSAYPTWVGDPIDIGPDLGQLGGQLVEPGDRVGQLAFDLLAVGRRPRRPALRRRSSPLSSLVDCLLGLVGGLGDARNHDSGGHE
jgi:hypothetical protein